MADVPPSTSMLQGKYWAVTFFVTGAAGFFYEVGFGHDKLWGAACALWAAGGPALVADRLLKGFR